MFFDLDGFKAVNDQLGHDAGDRALVAFARVLRQNVLGSDLVARMGGDEFAVVLTRVHGSQDAVVVAERILDAPRTPLLPGDRPVRIGTSIGISLTTGQAGDDVGELLRRADQAMYEAKRDAGSGWRVHLDEPLPPPVPSPADAPSESGAAPGC
jgi:diguanylate cyclase (GGDEF)-like protein